MELADTSAWWWSARVGGSLRREFDEAIVEGQVGTCDMVRLELLHSARTIDEFRMTRADLDHLPDCAISTEHWRRALDVHEAPPAWAPSISAPSSIPTCLSRRRPKRPELRCCTTTRTTTASRP